MADAASVRRATFTCQGDADRMRLGLSGAMRERRRQERLRGVAAVSLPLRKDCCRRRGLSLPEIEWWYARVDAIVRERMSR